jgi:hypothetical protein
MKHTVVGSNEHSELQSALNLVDLVASHCNSSISVRMNASKLLHLQKAFGDIVPVIAPHRRLIYEGELKKQGMCVC